MQSKLRTLGLLLAFFLGITYHKELAVASNLVPFSLGIMIFLTFVGVEVEKLRPQALHLKLLIAMYCMAFICWAIPAACGYPILAESFFYCAAAPIATAAPVVIALMKGKVEFITTAMVFSQFIFSFIIPLILPFIVQSQDTPYWDIVAVILRQMFDIIILPAILACIVRLIYPKSIAWRSKTLNFSMGLWIFNISIVIAASTTRIIDLGVTWATMLPFILGALVICVTGYSLGYRLGKPYYAEEFSTGLGQKNTLLTLFIAAHPFADPLASIGPTSYIIFHNIANTLQIMRAEHRAKKNKA